MILALMRRLLGRDVDEVVGTLDFPRHIQWDGYSCGARCTSAIAEHYGLDVSYDDIKTEVNLDEDGTAMTPIMKFFRRRGLSAGRHRKMSWKQFVSALQREAVVLVDLDGTHWSVAYAASSSHVWVSNPVLRQFQRKITRACFNKRWTRLGVVISDRR